MQASARSIGVTGFTRKSATFICISVRATDASNELAITMIGGRSPIEVMNDCRAAISASPAAPTSTMTTVAVCTSSRCATSDNAPATICNAMVGLAAKVARVLLSNAASGVTTTTFVFAAFGADLPESIYDSLWRTKGTNATAPCYGAAAAGG